MNIYGLSPQQISDIIGPKYAAYRHKQLIHWLYIKYQNDLSQMTDLPSDFKVFIAGQFDLALPRIDVVSQAPDSTAKYRLELQDGAKIEMVLIPEGKKLTLCISSQVGCARACSFCATGRMGFSRNLEI
ncbi:MAG TPA: 23S rRNA (adenine(2503)-C(2))-methyltransferase RlmN, partial [Candidatus Cloacimonadota bacterium]|nr:23S rRNA (adenine(2503)-C(2))-methyltransferase RlmN [Candidatus Cloacimonadota bacterium]